MLGLPANISGASVLLYSPIDSRHRHTGNCRQLTSTPSGAVDIAPGKALAICRYPKDAGVYLFHRDDQLNVIADTGPAVTCLDSWHQTIEEAKQQAEFEYEGVSNTWLESMPDA